MTLLIVYLPSLLLTWVFLLHKFSFGGPTQKNFLEDPLPTYLPTYLPTNQLTHHQTHNTPFAFTAEKGLDCSDLWFIAGHLPCLSRAQLEQCSSTLVPQYLAQSDTNYIIFRNVEIFTKIIISSKSKKIYILPRKIGNILRIFLFLK